ncbi:ribosome biogenesis protein Sqt1 [Metarhizium robertsii ARSEF 23]|uniref:Ribosome biogenesis protein Sqt1 n=1 Tax=Metarhizium robertsii (strain ARSEF 23 / ATCC MYA-3075) TaxID=655844 RepID=E9F833_METRA|nr:ribosome biogenesis protein Sqt1 [Metarhizium robertsii ARSEF 23]EFY96125.2 ribosome biogenesis protein Sqt1 [Metarhizium robertsii ARSEF 23]
MSHPEEMDDDLLDVEDAAEEIENSGDDIAMDSDAEDEEEEVLLQNDSIAYFDLPQDSLFTIAQHPLHPSLVAVGGSAGPEDDAPGAGWLFDTSAAASRPVLPASYASNPAETPKSTQLDSLFALEGHTDSINTLAWTLPRGEFLVSGGLDGRMKVWKADVRPGTVDMKLVGEAQEVEEVNWISACPSPNHPNTIALGASDGSVWVYTIDAGDASNPLQIVQSYFLHTAPCTAGAWTPDGHLLATVSEDSSLYVWDVWGEAAARNITSENGMTVVSLTGEDQRFEVEGGLYSIAIDPRGSFVAAGGAGGAVKVVSLPRLSPASSQQRGKSPADATAGGQILASLHTQGDSVESLAVSLRGDPADDAAGGRLRRRVHLRVRRDPALCCAAPHCRRARGPLRRQAGVCQEHVAADELRHGRRRPPMGFEKRRRHGHDCGRRHGQRPCQGVEGPQGRWRGRRRAWLRAGRDGREGCHGG